MALLCLFLWINIASYLIKKPQNFLDKYMHGSILREKSGKKWE